MFTIWQVIAFITGACAFLLTILNIIDKKQMMQERLNKPQKDLEERIQACERKIDDISRWLDNDKRSIEELKAANNMSMKVQYALLNHSIHKDNEPELKKVQEEMQQFLMSRGIT